MVAVKVKDEIGEQEYKEISASIDSDREIHGTDYITGQTFVGKVDAKTITIKTTADFNFKKIVNAEAFDIVTNEKFTTVWNPETNQWIKIVEIGTDLDNLAYFNDIDKSVSSGDLDLIVLSQGNNADEFPEGIPVQYYINTQIGLDGYNFSYLGNFSWTDTNPKELRPNRGGNLPWRFPGFIKGKTSDGKEVFLVIKTIPNSIGNINEHFFMDDALFSRLLQYGQDYFMRLITEQGETGFSLNFNIAPVIPLPSDVAPWLPGNPNYSLNVKPFYSPDVGAMQKPGFLFNLLPADIRSQIAKEAKGNTNVSSLTTTFKLIDGISPELARALSRSVLFPAFETIFYQ